MDSRRESRRETEMGTADILLRRESPPLNPTYQLSGMKTDQE